MTQQGYRQQSRSMEQADEDARRILEEGRAARAISHQSAPHSAAESASGLSPQPQWNKAFPRSPVPLSAYGPPNPAEIDAGRTGGPALDPYDWRGKVGVATPPPINNNGFTDKGAIIPDQATNYLGEKTYLDPSSNARVLEIDPSKDMRFSVINPATGQSQTSGVQTAAGIQAKYQTPGTTASFTPGTVTDANGNATNNGQTIFDRASAETALKAAHPEIFTPGTAQNADFVSYAKQHGEPAAHANVDSIMAATKAKLPANTDATQYSNAPAQPTAQNSTRAPLSAY